MSFLERNEIWDWIEKITDGEVLKNDVNSWGSKNWPGDVDLGFINRFGVGQSKWCRFVRSQPKIKKVKKSFFCLFVALPFSKN